MPPKSLSAKSKASIDLSAEISGPPKELFDDGPCRPGRNNGSTKIKGEQ